MSDRHQDPERDAIDAAASGWIVRIGDSPLSPEEAREFDRWRAADVRHDRAFAAMQRTWGDIAELGGLASLVQAPPSVPAGADARHARPVGRGPLLISAISAIAAALALVFVSPALLSPTTQNYQTRIAQTRRVVLPDGSIVMLGAKSAITVKFTDGERRIMLNGGEAFFEVAHNEQRPFLVIAGTSTVRDVGTRFDVNRGDDTVRVAVLEGIVKVSPSTGGSSMPATVLHGGEGMEVRSAAATSDSGETAPAPVTVTSAAQLPGAWREGRLIYDNARLSDLLADVNRYYAPGVKLDARAVGDLRITASLRTSEIPAFLAALDEALPVSTTQDADGMFRVMAGAGHLADSAPKKM